jgi:Ca2+-binding RTX toxin-like protein
VRSRVSGNRGDGNDTYVLGAGDTVVKNANEGFDTVEASVTIALTDNIENLTLPGNAAINETSNALDNLLTANSAANTLDGGGGANSMSGGSRRSPASKSA